MNRSEASIIAILFVFSALVTNDAGADERCAPKRGVPANAGFRFATKKPCSTGAGCVEFFKFSCASQSVVGADCCLPGGDGAGTGCSNCAPLPSSECDTSGNELCDGKDNNGNGVADENCAGECCAGESVACHGQCRTRFWVPCDPFGGAPTCTPTQNEICDGIDNNCNGVIDEGCFRAQCSSDPENESPLVGAIDSNSPVTCEQCPAKPVDLGTGGMTSEPVTDFTLDDPILPLTIDRRWSTELAERHADVRSASLFYPLGYGWSFRYTEFLETVYWANGAGPVLWTTPEGQQVVFDPGPTFGTYLRPMGRNDALVYAQNSMQYTLTKADGTRATFKVVSDFPSLGHSRYATLMRLDVGLAAADVSYYDASGHCPDFDNYDSQHKPPPGHPGFPCQIKTSTGRLLTFNWQLINFDGFSAPSEWRLVSLSGSNRFAPFVKYSYLAADCGNQTNNCSDGSLCCTQTLASSTLVYAYDYTSATLGPPNRPGLLKRVRRALNPAGSTAQDESFTVETHTWTGIRDTNVQTESKNLTLTYSPIFSTGAITSVNVKDAYSGTSYDAAINNGRVANITGTCGCNVQSHVWFTPGQTQAEGLQATVSIPDAIAGRFSVAYKRDALGRATDVSYNDNDTDPTTVPTDGQGKHQDFWNNTALLSQITHPSAIAGNRTTTLARSGTSPIITSTSDVGQTVADAVAHLGNATTGWAAQTQNRAYTWTTDPTTQALTLTTTLTNSGAGVLEQTVNVFWPPTGAGVGPEAGRLRKIRRYSAPGVSLDTSFGEDAATCGFPAGYDEYGNASTVRDPNGVVRCDQYDTNGRLVSTRLSTDAIPSSTWHYLDDGRFHSVMKATGETTRTVYYGEVATLDEFSRGLVRARERWSLDPDANNSIARLLERTEYEYVLAPTVLKRNLVTVERTVVMPANEGLSCTTNADCASDGITICSAGACTAKSCVSDVDCSSTGLAVCRGAPGAPHCMETAALQEYDYDNERRRTNTEVHRLSANLNLTTPEGLTQEAYDVAEHLTNTSDNVNNPNGLKTKFLYDGLNRVVEVDQLVGVSYQKMMTTEYDTQSKVSAVVHFNSGAPTAETERTRYTYDDFGRLTRIDSPDGGRRVYTYDEAGRRTNMTVDSNASTQSVMYQYDWLGRVTQLSSTSGVLWPVLPITFTYDETAWGSMTDCRTNAAASLPANRYALGRLSTVAFYTFGYGSNQYRYAYSPRGELLLEAENRHDLSGCNHLLRYTYSSVVPSRVIQLDYPSGRSVMYGYASAFGAQPTYPNRVDVTFNNATVNVVQNATYGKGGRLRRIDFANGLREQVDWALDGSPLRKLVYRRSDGKVFMRREVSSYNEHGQPLVLQSRNTRHFERFTYDADFERLTSAQVTNAAGTVTTGSGHAYSSNVWSYDANLLGSRHAADNDYTYNYAAGSGRLAAISSLSLPWAMTSYGYDQQGDVTSVSTLQYIPYSWRTVSSVSLVYDALDRLLAWGGTNFNYDYRNLRMRKVSAVNSLPTDFFYSPNGVLLGELGCSSTTTCDWPRPVQEYVYLGDELVGLTTGSAPATGATDDTAGAIQYVHTGLLSEPLRITNGSQEIVWKRDHTPWGQVGPGDYELDDMGDPVISACYATTGDSGTVDSAGARSLQVKFDLFKTEGGYDPVTIERADAPGASIWTKSGNLADDGLGCCSDGTSCTGTSQCSSCQFITGPAQCSGPFWTSAIQRTSSSPVDGLSLYFTPDFSCNSASSNCSCGIGCPTCTCTTPTCPTTANCCGCSCTASTRYRGVKATQFRANYTTVLTDAKALTVNLRLPGQYEDTETGLFYNWNRYYNPSTGRYLSPDPELARSSSATRHTGASSSGDDAYGYAEAKPTRFTDPTGQYALSRECPNFTESLRRARLLAGCDGNCGLESKTCASEMKKKGCDLCNTLTNGTSPLLMPMRQIPTPNEDGTLQPSVGVTWGYVEEGISTTYLTGILQSDCEGTGHIDDLANTLIHEAMHSCDLNMTHNALYGTMLRYCPPPRGVNP